MSTNDVPGAKASNGDTLALGSWAEHDDGSLIFVESTEGGRVIYSVFDMSKDPVVEYRDAESEAQFKKSFSWDPSKPKTEKWTWHDKTPFPWDRIIKAGVSDGPRFASARDQLTAAERLAQRLKLAGHAVDDDIKTRADQTVPVSGHQIMDKLSRAIAEVLK